MGPGTRAPGLASRARRIAHGHNGMDLLSPGACSPQSRTPRCNMTLNSNAPQLLAPSLPRGLRQRLHPFRG